MHGIAPQYCKAGYLVKGCSCAQASAKSPERQFTQTMLFINRIRTCCPRKAFCHIGILMKLVPASLISAHVDALICQLSMATDLLKDQAVKLALTCCETN
eukprot:1147009-Pelagomonas_calceolata.AAC.2